MGAVQNPMSRIRDPLDDVLPAVLLLATEDARHVAGFTTHNVGHRRAGSAVVTRESGSANHSS